MDNKQNPSWVETFLVRYEHPDPIISGKAVDDLCDVVNGLDAEARMLVMEACK